ncbi:hypothetical protein LCGC14_2364840 [marine sediment metagenome]|uniref:Uncharacterized protein n=1 Tax=marine sediment metagenome TaxID=412755 RepID=A0A0F9C5R7_9ZZZZ
MLKHTKYKNQDPKKVIKKKEFKDWFLKKTKKEVKKGLSEMTDREFN